jgi:uncharacterized membrane protein required for colicin V production
MQTIDIVFLVISAFFLILGIKRGFIGEIIRIMAMIGGFFIAFLYYNDVALHLSFLKQALYITNAVAFVIIYIVCALGIICVGWIIKKIVHLTLLGWLDRLLGGLIGFAKAGLFAWIICLTYTSFQTERTGSNFEKSFVFRTYKKLPDAINLRGISSVKNNLKKIVPPAKKEKINQKFKKIKNSQIPNKTK